MAKQVQVKKIEIPEGWSIEAADFINKVKSIKLHSYFKESQQTVLDLEEPQK